MAVLVKFIEASDPMIRMYEQFRLLIILKLVLITEHLFLFIFLQVAVKFEVQKPNYPHSSPQLRHEYKVYKEMTNCVGFGRAFHYGVQENYNVLIMDLLGPSLDDLFNVCHQRFSLKTGWFGI